MAIYRYKRKRLEGPTHLPEAKLLWERDSFEHAWVFLKTLDAESVYCAQKTIECISDEVKTPAPHIYYGSLKNTSGYFGNYQAMRREVIKVLREFPPESRPVVVLGSHFFRSFVYGCREEQNARILVAHAHNLNFRTFTRDIKWEEWYRGASLFADLFKFKSEEKTSFFVNLKEFVEKSQMMRFSLPNFIPQNLVELERRFGPKVSELWRFWQQGTQTEYFHESNLNDYGQTLHPKDLITEHTECEQYKDLPIVALSKFSEVFKETVYACVEKIQKFNNFSHSFGLRDLSVHVRFDNHLQAEETLNLTSPIYSQSKLSDAILEQLSNKFQFKEGVIPSPDDDSLHYYIYQMESLTVVPVSIHIKNVPQFSIFEEDTKNSDFENIKKIIALKEQTKIYGLEPVLSLIDSYSESGQHCALYRYAHNIRPVSILVRPIVSSFPEIEKKHKIKKMSFLESVDGKDYFALILEKHKSALWIECDVSLRSIPLKEKVISVKGIFDKIPLEGFA